MTLDVRWTDHGYRERLLSDYAAIVRRKAPMALERTLQRTQSVLGRDVVAWLATGGQLGYDELVAEVHDRPATAGAGWDPRWIGALAWVMASQDLRSDDRSLAGELLRHVWHRAGPAAMSPLHQRLHLDLLRWEERWDELAEALPMATLPAREGPRYRADLANPYLEAGSARHALDGLDRFNEALPREMGGVAVLPGAPTPFDGLWARGVVAPDDEGLVSVIVSVFDPGEELRTSIDSLTRQTYRNLEIIIVDDASTNDPGDLLAEVAAADNRITVVRLARNGGTYACRNYALALARGTFVTFQDDDDWSHPDRIAHQVQAMTKDPSIVATTVRCVRATSDLGLVRVGYRETALNTSSLMMRRAPVLARLGFYDPVRKGGDTEYVRRLATVFGEGAVVALPQTLSIVRVGEDSLSSSDFKPGWQHRSRWMYKTLYARWHDATSAADGVPSVNGVVGREGRFPAPRSMDRTTARQGRYDVVLVGDWRAYGGPQRSMMAEIDALLAAGRRVAVSHLEAFRFMVEQDRPLCDPILELIERGVVDYLLLDDDVEVDHVMVRYPPVLQFASAPSRWRAERVSVVANQAPFEFDGSDTRYDPSVCSHNAEATFGVPAVWIPQGPVVREVLVPLLDPNRLAPFDMPGVLDVALWPPRRDSGVPPAERPLVVGRVSRDSVNKFPVDGAELRAAYSVPHARIRMLGAAKTVPALLGGDLPVDWELLPANAVDVQEFLAGVDVFVYFDNPTAREAFGRVVLEAIASGCLVVLPERYRDTFGDAAVYCAADEVAEVIATHVTDPVRWRTQTTAARRVFEREFSFAAQVRRFDQAADLVIR